MPQVSLPISYWAQQRAWAELESAIAVLLAAGCRPRTIRLTVEAALKEGQ